MLMRRMVFLHFRHAQEIGFETMAPPANLDNAIYKIPVELR